MINFDLVDASSLQSIRAFVPSRSDTSLAQAVRLGRRVVIRIDVFAAFREQKSSI